MALLLVAGRGSLARGEVVAGLPAMQACHCRRVCALQARENLRSSQVTGKPADSMAARISVRSLLIRPKYQRSGPAAVRK
jgi:hypothetical protein